MWMKRDGTSVAEDDWFTGTYEWFWKGAVKLHKRTGPTILVESATMTDLTEKQSNALLNRLARDKDSREVVHVCGSMHRVIGYKTPKGEIKT